MQGSDLFDNIRLTGMVCVKCSQEGKVETVSETSNSILTKPSEFFIDKSIFRFISPDYRKRIIEIPQLLASNAVSQTFSIKLEGEGVVTSKVLANITSLEDQSFLCVLMAKPQTDTLKDHENFRQMEVMRTTLESLDDIVVVLDSNGFFSELYSHSGETNTPGFVSAFKVGSRLSDVGFPDNVVELLNQSIEEASSERKTVQINYSIKAFGGELFYQAKISPRFTSDEQFDGVTILIRDITSVKKTEQKLKKSLEYFLTVLDHFPNPIWRLNSLKKFDYFNKTWSAFTNFNDQEQTISQWEECIHADDRENILQTLDSKFVERKPFSLEYRLLHHTGNYRWIKNFCQPLFDIKGRFTGYMGTCVDFDDIRTTQKLLQDSESRYRAMVEEQNDLVVRWGSNFTINFVNNSFGRFFGVDIFNLTGKLWINLFDKRQRSVIRKAMESLIASPKTGFFETEIADTKGNLRVYQWLNSPVFDKNGKVIEYQSVGRDITEKIEKEKENQQLLQKLNVKVKELSLLNKVSQYINEGFSEEKLFIKLIDDIRQSLFDPGDVSVVITCNEKQYATEPKPPDKSFGEVVFPFGNFKNCHLKIISLSKNRSAANGNELLSKGERELFKSACEMLTSYIVKVDTEKKLHQSELRFRELFESVLDIVFNLDMDGRVIKINPAAQKILGYDAFEGSVFWDFAVPSDRRNIESTISKTIANGDEYFAFETKALTGSGEIVFLHVGGIVRCTTAGEPEEIFGIARDITQQKRLEQNIMKTVMTTQEKERKRFAEDLHDGIGPLLSGLKMYLQQDSMAADLNEKQLKVLKFCRELVDDAISQARSIANNLTPNVLNDFGIEKALISHVSKINEIGKFKTDLAIQSSLEKVENDISIAIFRIISELLNNTLKHAECTLVKIGIGIKKNILMITYMDNGKGFDPDNPKSATSGSEVGINSIYNRVHSLNGSISLKSSSGQGVKVDMFIPLRCQ